MNSVNHDLSVVNGALKCEFDGSSSGLKFQCENEFGLYCGYVILEEAIAT